MGREVGKIQPQNSSRRIISNQSSNSNSASSSSIDSDRSIKMRKPLLTERWTSILYTLVVSLLYATAGTMVGWSSGTFRRSNAPSAEPVPLPLLDNWSISLTATPAIIITVTAFFVHRSYQWIGTKAFLQAAALLAIGSSALEAYGVTFWSVSAARVLAGIAAGIAFTLVPSYVDECGSATAGTRHDPNRPPLQEILATAFPLGVLFRFAADLLPLPANPTCNAVLWGILPTCAFLGLLFLPDSARFLCATGRVAQAATNLQRTHEPSVQPGLQECLARWQQPVPGLVEAFKRQANFTLLVPLLALFALQAFLGAVPMLFYLAELLELAGEQQPGRGAALLVTILTLAVPLGHYLHTYQHRYHRSILVVSALLTAAGTLALGWQCHERRTRALDLTEASTDWPLYCFALLYVAYAAGFYRLPDMLLSAEVTDENLFALRTLATAIGWGSVYLAVRLLPVLLRTIGLGWVLWNVALVSLSAAGLVLLCLPAEDEYAHKTLPTGPSSSMTSSVCSSGSGAPSCWPCSNETTVKVGDGPEKPNIFMYTEKTHTPSDVIRGPELV